MSKFAKVVLIAAGVMIGLGLLFGAIVTAIGGPSLVRNVTNGGIVNIGPWGVAFGDWRWGWGENNHLSVNGDRISGKFYRADFSDDNVKNINITVGVGEFKIMPWSNSDFKIEIDGIGACEYYVNGSTLYVEGFNLVTRRSSRISIDNKLVLYVPDNIDYDSIKLKVGVGALEISGLNVNNLETESGVGSLAMIDMVAGRLNIANSIGETVFSGEVGTDIMADCNIGNISLRIRGAYEDFNYLINCSLGSITVGRYSYTSLANESRIENNASKTMNLNCSLGNIDVSFY
ncbi:MAG: DUF4097 family beta strand repeat-containing protein [Lachnospiraceae bacterium]|nr:DUF4097 family beta strand repeat-containing protein [Lachnospiraceae bacterium]